MNNTKNKTLKTFLFAFIIAFTFFFTIGLSSITDNYLFFDTQSPLTIEKAYATDAGDSGYANELMSGSSNDRGGWDENLLQETGGNSRYQGNDAAGNFVEALGNISRQIAQALMTLVILLIVVRFVGRGLIELFMDKNQKADIPTLFLTADERKSSGNSVHDTTQSRNWATSMFKDSVKYLIIAAGVWFFLSLLSGIVILVINAATGSMPSDWTYFSVGGINVHTS